MPYCCATLISAISARTPNGRTARNSAAAAAARANATRMGPPESVNPAIIGASGALVEARQHELAVTERLGRRQPAVRGAKHHVDQLVAGLVHRDLALQKAGRV